MDKNGTSHADVFHVGHHCDEKTCNRLDFLPVRCDGCSKNFCNDHFRYESHNCSSGQKTDYQVPTCPLCQAPIPIKRGEIPDIRVGQHIDSDCMSDKALSKRKVFTNVCTAKGCKKKEMMRVECTNCRKVFCLAHRFPDDHQCQGPTSSVSKAGAAALARLQGSVSSANQLDRSLTQQMPSSKVIQANMSEDEALARALQISLNGGGDFPAGTAPDVPAPLGTEYSDDLAVAQALTASEQEYQAQTNRKKANCVMS